jgi:hypothetical protein
MEQAPDIGAMHAHPAPLQFNAELVQRQFAHLRQPPAHERGMWRQLAAAGRMALTARLERTRLPPQLHQLVHKPGRNAEMPRRLPMSTTLVDIRGNSFTQRHR